MNQVLCCFCRVLNVMRHWVDHHFLDFESDPYLLDKMRRFLQEHVAVENQRRSIKRWINSILKMIERKVHIPPTIWSRTNLRFPIF